MAEQTSWTNPGSVSSAERAAPPTVSPASKSSTDQPARASVIAAPNPFGPAPITTASRFMPLRGVQLQFQGYSRDNRKLDRNPSRRVNETMAPAGARGGGAGFRHGPAGPRLRCQPPARSEALAPEGAALGTDGWRAGRGHGPRRISPPGGRGLPRGPGDRGGDRRGRPQSGEPLLHRQRSQPRTLHHGL